MPWLSSSFCCNSIPFPCPVMEWGQGILNIKSLLSNQAWIACIIPVLAVKCSVYNEVLKSICYCTCPPAFNSPVNCTISGNMVTVPKFSSTTVSESKFVTVIKIKVWLKRSTDGCYLLGTTQPLVNEMSNQWLT